MSAPFSVFGAILLAFTALRLRCARATAFFLSCFEPTLRGSIFVTA